MSATKTFKDLMVGTPFEFSSAREMPFSGMARGPWVKLSAMRYYHRDNPALVHRVGSSRVKVDLLSDLT